MKAFKNFFSKKQNQNNGFNELDLAPEKMENFVHTKNVDDMKVGTTLTVFFSGTGSHIDKDTDSSLSYPEGELISNLYKNCKGPCIQVDGVGTNDENSMYNIATGSGVTNRVKIVHDFIREHPEFTNVNIVGWSRGGVESIMLANALDGQREYDDLEVDVNIMAFDPVPGTDGLKKDMDMKTRLGKNVSSYKAFYARDETSNSFSPIVPEIDPEIENPETIIDMKVVPGRHATLVGNYSVRGDQLKENDSNEVGNASKKQRLKHVQEMIENEFDPDLVENVHETGKLVRDEAEKQLKQWGTPLEDTLDLSKKQIKGLTGLQQENSQIYKNMHDHTYPTPQEKISGKGKGSENGDRLMHRVNHFDDMGKQIISDFEQNLDDYNITPKQLEQNQPKQVGQSKSQGLSFDEILYGVDFGVELDILDVGSSKSKQQQTPVVQNGDKELSI